MHKRTECSNKSKIPSSGNRGYRRQVHTGLGLDESLSCPHSRSREQSSIRGPLREAEIELWLYIHFSPFFKKSFLKLSFLFYVVLMFFTISLILFYNLLFQFLEHLIFKLTRFIIFPIFTVLFNYIAFSPCFWFCIFADLVFSIHFTMGSFLVLISYFLTPVFTVIFVFFLSSFLFVSVWDYLGVLGYWLLLSSLVLGFIFCAGGPVKSWCYSTGSGLNPWGGRHKYKTLDHKRTRDHVEHQLTRAHWKVSISTVGPSPTQSPESSSAGILMPNL